MTKAKRYNRYSSEFKREAILRAGEAFVRLPRYCWLADSKCFQG